MKQYTSGFYEVTIEHGMQAGDVDYQIFEIIGTISEDELFRKLLTRAKKQFFVNCIISVRKIKPVFKIKINE